MKMDWEALLSTYMYMYFANLDKNFEWEEMILSFQEESGAFSLDLKPAIEATKMSECTIIVRDIH